MTSTATATTTIPRPECAGWHEADPICDGDPRTGEPPCSFKGKCLRVKQLAGDDKTEAAIRRVLATYTDDELIPVIEEAQEPREGLAASPTDIESPETTKGHTEPSEAPEDLPAEEVPFTFPPILSTKGGRVMTNKTIYPRPSPRYDHVLPVVDMLLARFAREVSLVVRLEGDPKTRPGDLFIRWTPGMAGRTASIYQATDRGTMRHRLIARLIMLVREPRFNLKTNIPDTRYAEAVALTPPVGPDCRVWEDVKPHVALVGVDQHAVRDSAKWLSRCFKAGLISDVKRRKKKASKKPRKAIS